MIDVHTHLWPAELSPVYMEAYFAQKRREGQTIRMTCSEILRSMDECSIDKAIVSTLAFDGEETNAELKVFHEYVREQVELSDGRLMAFCTVKAFDKDNITVLEDLMSKGCFKGVKLHPNIQRFYPDDERLFPVYEWLEKRRLPILFHTGGIGLSGVRNCFGELGRLDNVACEFPNLPVIMGHAGRIHYHETAELLRKHSNVYADISTNFGRIPGKEWLQLKELMETVKIWSGTTDKLMLGSDYPFYSQKKTVDIIQNYLTEWRNDNVIDKEDIEDMLYKNADKFCEKYCVF